MNLYLDTSSLLKLFLVEERSNEARDAIDRADNRWTSTISIPEGRGGLARAARGFRLSTDEYVAADAALQELLSSVQLVQFSGAAALEAGDLAARFYLRGLDALHLASALIVQRDLEEPVAFSAFDDRLLDAAEECGLART